MTGIYIIENLINGKKYIGQAENIGSRWTTHIRRGSGLEIKYISMSVDN